MMFFLSFFFFLSSIILQRHCGEGMLNPGCVWCELEARFEKMLQL